MVDKTISVSHDLVQQVVDWLSHDNQHGNTLFDERRQRLIGSLRNVLLSAPANAASEPHVFRRQLFTEDSCCLEGCTAGANDPIHVSQAAIEATFGEPPPPSTESKPTRPIGPPTTPSEHWWRSVDIMAVHDGDTMTVAVDLGFDVTTLKPLRLYGINAPELKNPDGSGRIAYAFVRNWISAHRDHGQFLVRYVSWDKYAPRFDGVLVCGMGHCLNDAMLDSGNAVVYP